jgi:hypothetical protein
MSRQKGVYWMARILDGNQMNMVGEQIRRLRIALSFTDLQRFWVCRSKPYLSNKELYNAIKLCGPHSFPFV